MEENARVASNIHAKTSSLVKSTANSSKPFSFKGKAPHPLNKKLILLTQYHKTKNCKRDFEILESINKNIINPYIDEIILFTENLNLYELPDIFKNNSKVKVIDISIRLNYEFVFKFILERYFNPNLIFLLCNSDCFFDHTLNLLKYIDFIFLNSPLFLTMTRYEYNKGSLDIGKNPLVEQWDDKDYNSDRPISQEVYDHLPYLEPWSSDAWAFKINSVQHIKTHLNEFRQKLGTNLCEVLLVDSLIKKGVSCKNIGISGFVKCIHNHKSFYREKHNVSNFIQNKIPGFIPDPSRGVIKTKYNSINNCWRLRSKYNWLDAPSEEHCYSDFFVTDISQFLYSPI